MEGSWLPSRVHVSAAAVLLALCAAGCGGAKEPATTAATESTILTIDSTPPTAAGEGSTYTYGVKTSTPANFALAVAPAGATVQSGVISWTPTAAQARNSNQFTLNVTSGSQTVSQSWSVTPLGIIRGATQDRCVTDDGSITSVYSGYVSSVSLYFPKAGGGFDVSTGFVTADSFAISGVGPGAFWLVTNGNNAVWTNSNFVDFGYVRWGWCSNEVVSSAGTTISGTISGLDPSGGYSYFAVPNEMTSAGVFASTATTATYSQSTPLLLDAAKGDRAYVAQLLPNNYSGHTFNTIARFAGPLPLTLQNGVANTVDMTMQPVAQSQSLRGNIQGSAFAAQHALMHPNGTSPSVGFNFRLEVTPDASAPLGIGTYLAFTSENFVSDIDVGDVAFANPYPTNWTPYVDYTDLYEYDVSPTVRPGPVAVYLSSETWTTQLPSARAPLAPIVGPVTNPQLNGVSLFQDQTIAANPVSLSWQAPTTGTATAYRISIYQIMSGQTVMAPVGVYHTNATSATLPAPNLVPGNQYIFYLTSLHRQNDSTTQPFHETLPSGSTDVGSGVITIH